MAGASVVLVEAHPNPLIAKSDGFQGLFPEQLRALVRAARETWRLRRGVGRSHLPAAAGGKGDPSPMERGKDGLFPSRHRPSQRQSIPSPAPPPRAPPAP